MLTKIMLAHEAHSRFTRIIGAMSCAVAFTACVDMAEESPVETVGETAQAIGEPDCAYLEPSTMFWGFVPSGGYTSPQTYDPEGCHKAHAIMIDDYSPLHVGNGDYGGTDVLWADASPTTQAACEAALVRADLYHRKWFGWYLVESKTANGTWRSFPGSHFCELGVGWGDEEPEVLQPDRDYKIVATARVSGSGATRKFRVESTQDGWIE